MVPFVVAAHWNRVDGRLRPSFLSHSLPLYRQYLRRTSLHTTNICWNLSADCTLLTTRISLNTSLWGLWRRPLQWFGAHQFAVVDSLILDPTVGAVIWLQAEEGGDKWTANFLQVASGRFWLAYSQLQSNPTVIRRQERRDNSISGESLLYSQSSANKQTDKSMAGVIEWC